MRKRFPIWLSILRDTSSVRQLLVTGRAFSLLSFSSTLFFVVLGVAGMVHQQSSQSPIHSMKGFAASVSSGLFGDMLEMEMPSFESSLESESLTGKDISVFLMRTLTNINPNDPSSMLAGELPGMGGDDSFLIRRGLGTDTDVGPQDHSPVYDPLEGLGEEEGTQVPTEPIAEGPENGGELKGEITKGSKEGQGSTPANKNSKVVFIYHSHNRESWYPEIDKESKDASSSKKNITMLGKRLAKKLQEEGVGTIHSDTDYPSKIKGFRYELSYKYSMKTVKEAIASSKDLKFFFDLHRDSQKRKYTTIDIDGKSYAQVYFVIGNKNPNWKENEAFATKIHKALEKKYPGISRGIWGKNTGNAEYNQSLATDSALIEIGGIENTLEESYRTVDALAEVVSEIYFEAKKVSGKE
ncbi:stage II sporulation protein P [Paenibacillus sp. L3-i20]|uniref:stage II sporulation protein P n=1 Tax=Paenibacillus sp. L3-i20 TaxID=2905833 RepID=UPI001EE145C4|nr:stage II sporulation protein P [Paenibacillus sp. L3-i20]GKU79743.1 stage II sporulation protein P [Paenibacillus sp. L3-i20]